MHTPESTNNLFIRIWRRIRDFDETPRSPTQYEKQRALALSAIADIYGDVLSKVLDKFRTVDLSKMDPITIEVHVPGEKYRKFVAVQPVELKSFFDAVLDEAGTIEAKPYLTYDNNTEEQPWL